MTRNKIGLIGLAGIIGGAVTSLVSGINLLLGFSVPEGEIVIHWIGWGFYVRQLISGFVGGFILGTIFSFAYDHLPGKRGFVKGTVLATALLLIYLILDFVFLYTPSLPILVLIEVMAKKVVLILGWGAVVGYLWDKFR